MRIFLPERISMQWASLFGGAWCILQIIQRTNYIFAMLHLVFLLLSVHAFNVAGGFRRASGAFVFWYATLTILVGTATKAAIGDPTDSNLIAPNLMMGVYTVSAAVLLLAVTISRRVTQNVVSIAGRLRTYNLDYRNASIGCAIVGISIPFATNLLPSGPGTIFSVVRQLNYLTEIGIILGTISVIETSRGTRSWGLLNALPTAAQFLIGFSTFSKQGMFTPIVCWFIGVAYTRYKMRFWGLTALAGWMLFSFMVLTPIAQTGRDLLPVSWTWGDGFEIAVDLLVHIDKTRELYLEQTDTAQEASGSYFGRNLGILSRFTRIDGDDPLIAYSAQGHYIGYDSVWYSFLNWFPHLLLPDKEKYAPVAMGGNYYAREIGWLPPQDTTTGISFGAAAEAFHFDGWQAVILVLLLLWVLLLTSVDLLCGDLRRSPWGLFFAVVFAHIAPESGVTYAIQFIWMGNLGLFVCMVFSTYVAPVIGSALSMSTRRRSVGRTMPPASLQAQPATL